MCGGRHFTNHRPRLKVEGNIKYDYPRDGRIMLQDISSGAEEKISGDSSVKIMLPVLNTINKHLRDETTTE